MDPHISYANELRGFWGLQYNVAGEGLRESSVIDGLEAHGSPYCRGQIRLSCQFVW